MFRNDCGIAAHVENGVGGIAPVALQGYMMRIYRNGTLLAHPVPIDRLAYPSTYLHFHLAHIGGTYWKHVSAQ